MNAVTKQRQILDRRGLTAAIDTILGEKGYDSLKRQDVVQCLKDALQAGQDEIRARFDAGGTGVEVFAGNAFLIDQLVRVIFDIATERAYPVANKTSTPGPTS
mgnify:FL=1